MSSEETAAGSVPLSALLEPWSQGPNLGLLPANTPSPPSAGRGLVTVGLCLLAQHPGAISSSLDITRKKQKDTCTHSLI